MAHISKKLSLPTLDRIAREVMHDIHQHINMGLIPWFAHVRTVLRVHAGVVCQLGWESCPRVKVRWILPRHSATFALHIDDRVHRAKGKTHQYSRIPTVVEI